MKKHILLLIFFAAWLLAAQAQSYVAAKSGLNLRETPDASGKVITKIPFGAQVTPVNTSNEQYVTHTAEGISSVWIKVSYGGKTGYVFNGFLLPVPPPTQSSMEEYISHHFKKLAGPFEYEGKHNNDGSDAYLTLSQTVYDKGIYQVEYGGYEYGSTSWYLPEISLEQAFLICRLIPEFRGFIGENDPYPERESSTETRSVKFLQPNGFKTGIQFEYAEEGPVFVLQLLWSEGRIEIISSSGI